MTKTKCKNLNFYDIVSVHKNIKKYYKKNTSKEISSKEIETIWKSYCECFFVPELLNGKIVIPLNRKGYGKFEIVKNKREDTIAGKLFAKGVMFQRAGKIKKEVKINQTRWNYVYKIKYVSSDKVIQGIKYKATPKITSQLCNILNNTAKDYKFEMK